MILKKYNIFITTTLINKIYENRFYDFLKYGLINKIDDFNICYLIGPNDKIDENLNYIRFKEDHHCHKISMLYHEIIKTLDNEERWFVKIDDDSITDLELMKYYLDKEKINFPNFFSSNCMHLYSKEDRSFFKSYNKNLNLDIVGHEFEIGIFNSSFFRLLCRRKSLDFLSKRSEYKKGFSDQISGQLSRVSNVNICKRVEFITHKPEVSNFSLFNGKLCHIHYVSNDMNKEMFNIVKSKINGIES